MDNALVDDRRIKVNFSQSVAYGISALNVLGDNVRIDGTIIKKLRAKLKLEQATTT
jgi:hypothetical protein